MDPIINSWKLPKENFSSEPPKTFQAWVSFCNAVTFIKGSVPKVKVSKNNGVDDKSQKLSVSIDSRELETEEEADRLIDEAIKRNLKKSENNDLSRSTYSVSMEDLSRLADAEKLNLEDKIPVIPKLEESIPTSVTSGNLKKASLSKKIDGKSEVSNVEEIKKKEKDVYLKKREILKDLLGYMMLFSTYDALIKQKNVPSREFKKIIEDKGNGLKEKLKEFQRSGLDNDFYNQFNEGFKKVVGFHEKVDEFRKDGKKINELMLFGKEIRNALDDLEYDNFLKKSEKTKPKKEVKEEGEEFDFAEKGFWAIEAITEFLHVISTLGIHISELGVYFFWSIESIIETYKDWEGFYGLYKDRSKIPDFTKKLLKIQDDVNPGDEEVAAHASFSDFWNQIKEGKADKKEQYEIDSSIKNIKDLKVYAACLNIQRSPLFFERYFKFVGKFVFTVGLSISTVLVYLPEASVKAATLLGAAVGVTPHILVYLGIIFSAITVTLLLYKTYKVISRIYRKRKLNKLNEDLEKGREKLRKFILDSGKNLQPYMVAGFREEKDIKKLIDNLNLSLRLNPKIDLTNISGEPQKILIELSNLEKRLEVIHEYVGYRLVKVDSEAALNVLVPEIIFDQMKDIDSKDPDARKKTKEKLKELNFFKEEEIEEMLVSKTAKLKEKDPRQVEQGSGKDSYKRVFINPQNLRAILERRLKDSE